MFKAAKTSAVGDILVNIVLKLCERPARKPKGMSFDEYNLLPVGRFNPNVDLLRALNLKSEADLPPPVRDLLRQVQNWLFKYADHADAIQAAALAAPRIARIRRQAFEAANDLIQNMSSNSDSSSSDTSSDGGHFSENSDESVEAEVHFTSMKGFGRWLSSSNRYVTCSAYTMMHINVIQRQWLEELPFADRANYTLSEDALFTGLNPEEASPNEETAEVDTEDVERDAVNEEEDDEEDEVEKNPLPIAGIVDFTLFRPLFTITPFFQWKRRSISIDQMFIQGAGFNNTTQGDALAAGHSLESHLDWPSAHTPQTDEHGSVCNTDGFSISFIFKRLALPPPTLPGLQAAVPPSPPSPPGFGFSFSGSSRHFKTNAVRQHIQGTGYKPHYRLVACDPGSQNISFCMEILENGQEATYTLTRKQWRHETHGEQRLARTSKWCAPFRTLASSGVEAGAFVLLCAPGVCRKTSSLAQYLDYSDLSYRLRPIILEETMKYRWAQENFLHYQLRQRALSNFWARVKRGRAEDGTLSQNPMVAYGDAQFATSMKGIMTAPTTAAYLACVNVMGRANVVLTTEYRTSQCCSGCGGLLSNIYSDCLSKRQLSSKIKYEAKTTENPNLLSRPWNSPLRFPVRGLKICKHDDCPNKHRRFVDRDLNAARNIRAAFLSQDAGYGLPPHLDRSNSAEHKILKEEFKSNVSLSKHYLRSSTAPDWSIPHCQRDGITTHTNREQHKMEQATRTGTWLQIPSSGHPLLPTQLPYPSQAGLDPDKPTILWAAQPWQSITWPTKKQSSTSFWAPMPMSA
jgi:hypothetical protein